MQQTNNTQIDSAFQLTEHIKALHYHYTHPDALTTVALSKEQALLLSEPPKNTDRALWLYELCRFLVQKINSIITSLFADTPACSSATCPEMRASEWQYLCAVHDPPKPCCAIDYCCHTLDWAANVLTNPKHFPSRLALTITSDTSASGNTNSQPSQQPSTANANVPQHQVRQLTNIFRRVYRIFAHAWFQHRDMFWRVEHETGLYVFYKTVCDVYNLIPADNYTIPPEAEGEEAGADAAASLRNGAGDYEEAEIASAFAAPAPNILRRPAEQAHIVDASAGSNTVVAAGGARRHRRDLSKTALNPVETLVEEPEEEDAADDTGSVIRGRPTTLHETQTQARVAQAGGQGEDEVGERSSGFPDFDEEDEDEEHAEQRHGAVEESNLAQTEQTLKAHEDDAEFGQLDPARTTTLPERPKDGGGGSIEMVRDGGVREQARAPAADADAAGLSVED